MWLGRYVCERDTAGFDLISEWLKKWREFFKPIVQRLNAKLLFDTQLETTIWNYLLISLCRRIWISLAVWFVRSRLRENIPQYGPRARLVARKYHTNKSLRLIRLYYVYPRIGRGSRFCCVNVGLEYSTAKVMCLWFQGKRCPGSKTNIKPRSCVDHLKNGSKQCGYYKIYDIAGNGFTVYCDMETEPGAAWTLVVSWSLKNKGFSNFR